MPEGDGSTFTRRQVVNVGGLAALAAVPGLRKAVPLKGRPTPRAKQADVRQLGLDRFAPHVGTRFAVQTVGGPASVLLEEATARKAHPADRKGLRGDAFSLTFRGPPGAPALVDGSHRLRHPALGSVPLFLVAVGRAKDGQDYQAVFDRRIPIR